MFAKIVGMHIIVHRHAPLRESYYYRCLGSDDYRYPQGRVCPNRPIRQDYIDQMVWEQIVELLSNPELVRTEIHRRIKEIQNSNPAKQRKGLLAKQLRRVKNSIQKLLDAYQEDLLQLEELRDRMPQLRKREKTLQAELASLDYALADQQAVLRLGDNIEHFLRQLRKTADTLNVVERQKVLRLVVKEILVDDETITIKHSIPISNTNISGDSNQMPEIPGYLLRSRRHHTPLGRTTGALTTACDLSPLTE